MKNPDISMMTDALNSDHYLKQLVQYYRVQNTNTMQAHNSSLVLVDYKKKAKRYKRNKNKSRVERRARSSESTRRMTTYLAADKTLKKPIASCTATYVWRGNG